VMTGVGSVALSQPATPTRVAASSARKNVRMVVVSFVGGETGGNQGSRGTCEQTLLTREVSVGT
jgi:hypothetical protein